MLYNGFARFVLNYSFGTHYCEMLSTLNWLILSQRKKLNLLKMANAAIDGSVGGYFGAPC